MIAWYTFEVQNAAHKFLQGGLDLLYGAIMLFLLLGPPILIWWLSWKTIWGEALFRRLFYKAAVREYLDPNSCHYGHTKIWGIDLADWDYDVSTGKRWPSSKWPRSKSG